MRAGSPHILALAIVLALAASSATSAQQFVVSAPSLPPAPAALTVPNPFGPPPGTLDLYHRMDNFHSTVPQQQLPVFVPGSGYIPGFMSGYVPGLYAPVTVVVEAQRYAVPALAKGGLRLETEPGSAQVFVDGYYVGIVDDFGLRGKVLELTVGSHHVELRAPGYGVLSFDVNIAANQVSRFRGDLQLATPPPPATAANASSAPRKFYVIPNCYAGDRPPTRALPKGCNLGQMRVVENR